MIEIRTLKKIFYQMALSLKVLFNENENNKSFSSTITALLINFTLRLLLK